MENPVTTSVTTSEKKAVTTFEGVLERLKEATKTKSDSALARALGVKQSSVSSAKQRQQIPTHWVFQVSKKYLFSSDWLFFGVPPKKLTFGNHQEDDEASQGERRGSKQENKLLEVESAHKINTSNFTLVPKVKARLNAGNGSLLTGDEITGRYAFKNDWIRQKGDPGQMVLLDVFGESMEPVIWDGDTVLVDQSQTEVIPGRIYAVGIEDTVMIKYVELRPGVMALKSANEKWNDIEVDIRGDLAKSIRIVGRVIWWCREAR